MHQLWVPAMLAGAVDIALNDDGLGVVEHQLMRRPAEEPERRLNAVTPGSGLRIYLRTVSREHESWRAMARIDMP